MSKKTETISLTQAMYNIQKHNFTKDGTGNFGDYISLDQIESVITHHLGKTDGYIFIQTFGSTLETKIVKESQYDDEPIHFETALTSGEFPLFEFAVAGEIFAPDKLGSVITYFKRYQLSALFGINCSMDLDEIGKMLDSLKEEALVIARELQDEDTIKSLEEFNGTETELAKIKKTLTMKQNRLKMQKKKGVK